MKLEVSVKQIRGNLKRSAAIGVLALNMVHEPLLSTIKTQGLSLKMLAEPQVSGPCLVSLLGPPNEASNCLQWAANVDAAPSVDGRRLIYVGAGDNYLHVLDGDTGKPFAQIKTQGRVITQVLWSKNKDHFFFGTDKGVVSCHDAFTFAKIFSFQADGTINNDMILDDDSLIFSTGLLSVFRIDNKTGQEQWRILRPLSTNRLILASNSNIVVFKNRLKTEESNFLAVPHPEGYISIISALKGPENMRTIRLEAKGNPASFPDIIAPMIYANGLLWVASFDMGIFILDPENGHIRNRIPIPLVSQLAFDSNRVYGATNKELLAFSQPGIILWRTAFGDLKTKEARYGYPFSRLRDTAKRVFMGVPSTLLVNDEKIIMATSQGAMGEFDAKNGALVRIVGNSLGFGPKIATFGQGVMASTRRGLLALFQK